MRHTKKEMSELKAKNGESIIPEGLYCYDQHRQCPYWDRSDEHPNQRNGYCWFLERGDWEINDEKYYEDMDTHKKQTANEIGLPLSLLWDQCKECDVNVDYSSE